MKPYAYTTIQNISVTVRPEQGSDAVSIPVIEW